jgi:MFS family permease
MNVLFIGGRLGWAAISDVIGRKKVFYIFTLGSIPLYMALPTLVENVVSTGSSMPLTAFCASTVLAVSIMGGIYAVLPAYEADLFGTRYAGAVHGRMLLFSSIAALSGKHFLKYVS